MDQSQKDNFLEIADLLSDPDLNLLTSTVEFIDIPELSSSANAPDLELSLPDTTKKINSSKKKIVIYPDYSNPGNIIEIPEPKKEISLGDGLMLDHKTMFSNINDNASDYSSYSGSSSELPETILADAFNENSSSPQQYTQKCLNRHKYFTNEKSNNNQTDDEGKLVKTYKCVDCKRTFLRQDVLRKHERTHSKKKNGPQYAEMQGYTNNHLTTAYHCDLCQTLFLEKSSLDYHRLEVHGRASLDHSNINQKPVIINSLRNDPIQIQMRAQIIEKTYLCCGKTFKYQTSLLLHQKTHKS